MKLAEQPTRTPAPNRSSKPPGRSRAKRILVRDPQPNLASERQVSNPDLVDCDGFRTLHHLGRGGMADVWKVEDERTGRQCALKVLHVAGEAIQQRLLREGQIQERLDHPNIVRVLRATRLRNGYPALLMEYVDGPPLDVITADFSLNTAQVDDLARQILGAVSNAHLRGVIHRDLKPENILLELEDEAVVAKVADFGLAKALHEDAHSGTVSGMVFGTPTHMAPEQFRDAKNVDARADVFSLGTILYELLTGRPTFERGDFIEVYCKARDGQYIPLKTLRPDLPQRMIDAVERALEPDPDQRIANAYEFLIVWCGVSRPPESPWSARHLAKLEDLSRAFRDIEPSALETEVMGAGPERVLPSLMHEAGPPEDEPTLAGANRSVAPIAVREPSGSFGRNAVGFIIATLARGLGGLAERLMSLVPDAQHPRVEPSDDEIA